MHKLFFYLGYSVSILAMIVLASQMFNTDPHHSGPTALSDSLTGVKATPPTHSALNLQVGDNEDLQNDVFHRAANDTAPRIFVIGGSTVISSQTPWPRRLERLLGQKVFISGVPSSNTRTDLLRLTLLKEIREGDTVIMYGFGNDLVMPFQAEPEPGQSPTKFIADLNPFLPGKQSVKTALLGVAAELNFFDSIALYWIEREYLPKRRLEVGLGSQSWTVKVVDTYVSDLLRAKRIAEGAKARFAAVQQPLVAYKLALAGAEVKFNDAQFVATAKLARSLVNAKLTAEPQLKHCDLTDLFSSNQEEAFVDGIHLHHALEEQVAQSVAECLRDRLL